MSKIRDPFAEYVAAKELRRNIISQISASQAYDPDSVESQTKLTHLTMALTQVETIKEEARKQYNENAMYIKACLEEGTARAQAGNVAGAVGMLFSLFEAVLQAEPLAEEDDDA